MKARLRLNLPWVPEASLMVDNVDIARDSASYLAFDDGIELEVTLLHPRADATVDDVVTAAHEAAGPGRVTLVVGPVPVAWRPGLRAAGVSWLASDGRMELRWPRLSASAHRVSIEAGEQRRQRDPLPLQKRQGVIAQELCTLALADELPMTVREIARRARVDDASASTACTALARQGLITKHRDGRRMLISVGDVNSLANHVRDRTSWRHAPVVWAHGYGRSPSDLAARISLSGADAGVPLAVTGTIGARFLGIIGTGDPPHLRIRVGATQETVGQAIDALGLHTTDKGQANLAIALDRWGLGTTNAQTHEFNGYRATIAPSMRVWCDLDDEQRGRDYAAELWEEMSRGG